MYNIGIIVITLIMSKVLVIDSEEKARDEMSKTLLSLNPQNKVESFANFEALEAYYKNLKEEEQPEFFKFDMMIFDYTLITPAHWEATINEFKARNPVEFSLNFTSYDNVHVNRKHILQLHARNIFYKPFDSLILKESLNISLKPKESVKPVEMREQVTQSLVAILKKIELVSICELGFITMNERPIERLSFSKYLSELFSSGKKQSVWAQCIMSIEVPNKPGFFINKFQFVGVESGALMNLRRHLQENKHKKVDNGVWNLHNSNSGSTVNIAVIDTKEDKQNKIKSDLESRFTNVKVDYIKIDPSARGGPSETQYECILNLNSALEYDDFKNKFNSDAKVFLLAHELVTEENLKK